MGKTRPIRVHAPDAHRVSVHSAAGAVELGRDGDGFSGQLELDEGQQYWLDVDGVGPLLDPHASDLVMTPSGPRTVVRDSWPRQQRGEPLTSGPVVYELHVRGFDRTFRRAIDRLGYLADLGITVIELMPVHPFDPTDNYWGYMPLIWGAVHRPYAESDDAPAELAGLVAAAHDHGLHVWLDVVFNHTGEGKASLPTWSLRGIDNAHAYRFTADGEYTDDSGCGNDIDPADPEVRRLVLEALDRYADLGIDGFRFDLASLLTRDGGGLVAAITAWAAGRGVVLIAEPWDLGAYQVGTFPQPAWLQWNDRFRDDVRGFVRAEPGLVPAIIQRVQGSPDLFGDRGARTVNFVTAHDGLTMHDLTIRTDDRYHSWDCGPELRSQLLRNYFTFLLLSAGTPMFVMGDEFARTQDGHDNPYDVDSELTWVDWHRLGDWAALHDFVRTLLAVRRRLSFQDVRCYGVAGEPDLSWESRSIAWATDDLYVMANMWWEPLSFEVQEPGDWHLELATAPPLTVGLREATLAPRSVAILRRQPER